MNKDKLRKHVVVKPVLWGVLAGLLLLSIYFLVLTFANSFSHAIEQFVLLWYWIILLVVGFGFQVGLYSYIRRVSKLKKVRGATSSVAATGGVSTGAMIACCAHHLTDILPILGLSAAAIFLAKYQTLFIIVGVLSNLIGINMMLNIIQKHNLKVSDKGILHNVLKINMKKSLYFVFSFSILIFFIVLFNTI
jgi:MFS family permease